MSVDPKYVLPNLAQVLADRSHPTITAWNRLEGRPRRDDLGRALRAEVRDALWMLTRQWQTGEFHGEDAGAPIAVKVAMRTAPVTAYQPAGSATATYDGTVPLEAQVEQRPIAWRWNEQSMRLDLRAQVGRQWATLLRAVGMDKYLSSYVARYPFTLPARDAAGDYVFAHRTSWQQLAALAGRTIDGGALLEHLAKPGTKASDGISAPAVHQTKLDAAGGELRAWFAKLYLQPAGDAWKPPYLEYQSACSVPQDGHETVLTSTEYAGGHLDWYSFDRAVGSTGLGAVGPQTEHVTIRSFLPAPVTFEGMPDPRWWALEDRKTDFGSIKPSTTDLAQLLLMEFGLLYSNDWFLIPFRIPAGTLARIDGMVVTNTFGERFWITAAGAGLEENWHRWGMFQLGTPATGATADTSLFIPPVTVNTLEGEPLEEIELARDEVANMVWAIERTIPSLSGGGRSGKDEARETRQYHEALVMSNPKPPEAPHAPIAYQAMTGVPEHWIPFLPVHVPGSTREVQLQRGSMLRIIEGDRAVEPPRVPPRTTLMREGLAVNKPYYIHEEEISRRGVAISEQFRRTRWIGGQAYVWLSVRAQTGRGERSSGLAFDSIVNTKR